MPCTRRVRPDAKLYRDIGHLDHWTARSAKIGWVHFRARPNGWAERKPVVEVDALRLSEVSLARAFNTGLIQAFQHQLSFPYDLGPRPLLTSARLCSLDNR